MEGRKLKKLELQKIKISGESGEDEEKRKKETQNRMILKDKPEKLIKNWKS